MLRIYWTAVEVLELLRPVIEQIERRDRALGQQMRNAGSSMVMNIAEGSYSRKGQRLALYNVALGSAKETTAGLHVSKAFRYIESVDPRIPAGLSSVCAVLYTIVR